MAGFRHCSGWHRFSDATDTRSPESIPARRRRCELISIPSSSAQSQASGQTLSEASSATSRTPPSIISWASPRSQVGNAGFMRRSPLVGKILERRSGEGPQENQEYRVLARCWLLLLLHCLNSMERSKSGRIVPQTKATPKSPMKKQQIAMKISFFPFETRNFSSSIPLASEEAVLRW